MYDRSKRLSRLKCTIRGTTISKFSKSDLMISRTYKAENVTTVKDQYKYRLHDLRHSAISYMLDSGVPLHVVQKTAGHASVVTTMLYVHVRDDISDRELEKFKIE